MSSLLVETYADGQSTKFPHTRAQLAAIARHARPMESPSEDEHDGEERVPSSLVNRVAALLVDVDENEDELKSLLMNTYTLDERYVNQAMLELMHKHRDDVAGVPFLFLTPTKRPSSRPSSRASNHSLRLHPPRPDTPNSAPSSPLAQIFKRPHTPATSPLAAPGGMQASQSYMTARPSSEYTPSPQSSPVLSHAQAAATQAQATFASSLPASPISSPRLLNAKASEFRPVIQRPLSAAAAAPLVGGGGLRAESPDMWAHNATNSPRATSNLAIAAPLIPERSRSQSPSFLGRSNLSRGSAVSDRADDEEDPFDPFASTTSLPKSFPYNKENQWSATSTSPPDQHGHQRQTYAGSSPEQLWNSVPASFSSSSDMSEPTYPSIDDRWEPEDELYNIGPALGAGGQPQDPDSLLLTDGMTPFDVLSNIFGSTLPPSELEDALAKNGYDFERASAWLVERALPSASSPPSQAPPRQQQNVPGGGRVSVVPREAFRGRGNGVGLGLYNAGSQRTPPRYVNGRPAPGGNRVCRYFVAGECLRSDCRFSHDLERALCRFWLRGQCAKNEQCEFLHHLPKDTDMQALSIAMARAGVQPGTGPLAELYQPPPPELMEHHDDFPVLGRYNNGAGGGQNGFNSNNDPGRTRFASAVKKPVMGERSYVMKDPMLVSKADASEDPGVIGSGRLSGSQSQNSNNGAPFNAEPPMAIIAPRPSPRLPLRPPTLIPSLPTGQALSQLYMTYRSRALQLGAARNACLSRAADAWRRGDGAAAKRFSRDANGLNGRMSGEMRDAALGLVRERGRVVREAVRATSSGGGERGKECGNGLGVVLGVSLGGDARGTGLGAGKTLTSQERMEAMLDLHGLHSNEATEVLEEFLLALEREHFYGLAYAIVGEEKHTGTQEGVSASRVRLAAGVKEWLHRWGYPWNERDGIVWIDPLTHGEE